MTDDKLYWILWWYSLLQGITIMILTGMLHIRSTVKASRCDNHPWLRHAYDDLPLELPHKCVYTHTVMDSRSPVFSPAIVTIKVRFRATEVP